jgi:MoxR-like ATPase
MMFATIEAVQAGLAAADYVASRALATTVFLALRMGRPLFLEGDAGVGKTEIAKVLARGLGRELIRLQCYDGLDAASAAYEWNFPRQMLEIRAAQAGESPRGGQTAGQNAGQTAGQTAGQAAGQAGGQAAGQTAGQAGGQAAGQTAGQAGGQAAGQTAGQTAGQAAGQTAEQTAGQTAERTTGQTTGQSAALDLYDSRFLLKRPLLRALEPHEGGPPVLLIDELDRADEPFEAYLLEVLSDFQISIPELGVIKAAQPPIVVITSNRTREIHDAIKRRCLYFWIDYPDAASELEILRRKAPEAPAELSRQVVAFVQKLRGGDLFKAPGIAETIDWTRALTTLDTLALDPQVVDDTLGALLKYQDDLARVQGATAAALIAEIRAEAAPS